MALETWVMVLDWRFLDRWRADEFLDRMAQASVTHLVFAGAPPIRPDPGCYADSPIPGVEPPPETLAR